MQEISLKIMNNQNFKLILQGVEMRRVGCRVGSRSNRLFNARKQFTTRKCHTHVQQMEVPATRFRKDFDIMAKKLNIQKQEDWYKISTSTFQENLPSHLSEEFVFSVPLALEATYPEFKWYLWKFKYVPRGFWTKKQNQRMYFDWLAEELNIETQQQWYDLTLFDIIRNDGYGLIASIYHPHSLTFHHALKNVYNEYDWRFFLFKQLPQGIWTETKNHVEFFDWFADEFGVHEANDWYDVIQSDLDRKSQKLLDRVYGGSLFLALQTVYPQFVWYDWLFEKNLKGYWLIHANQRKYCDWFADQLGIETQQDWYHTKLNDFRDRRANALLFHYNYCISRMLEGVYPEYEWLQWQFEVAPHSFWTMENQRKFFEWIEENVVVNLPDGWYSLKTEDIQKHGGGSLLFNTYQNSLANALSTVMPERDWHLWLFTKVPVGFWNREENMMKYVDWLCAKFDIKRVEDWFTLSVDQLRMNKGTALVAAGISKVLAKYYKHKIDPEIREALEELHVHSFKAEKRLLTILHRIFGRGDKKLKRKKHKFASWVEVN